MYTCIVLNYKFSKNTSYIIYSAKKRKYFRNIYFDCSSPLFLMFSFNVSHLCSESTLSEEKSVTYSAGTSLDKKIITIINKNTLPTLKKPH